jgi:glycerate 2-kinase
LSRPHSFAADMADLKEIAKSVFLRTLTAIDPGSAIRQNVRLDGETLTLDGDQIALDAYDEVVLIGMGKACLKMGAAAEVLFGERIKRGILVTDRRSDVPVKSEVVVAGHPLPDDNSLIAGQKIVSLVRSCGTRSLIVFLISGGGSSLVESPSSPLISLGDLRATNDLLIRCGAAIDEINVIRKTLSKIKGGRLGRLAGNSKCVALYVSDVNPGDLRSIASNPLLPEKVDATKVLDVVTRFNLMDELPASVTSRIRQEELVGLADRENVAELPSATMLLLDNSSAVQAAEKLGKEFGFRVEVDTDLIEGDYRSVADRSVDHLLKLKSSFPNERVCVISGGEVSCAVQGDGIGGRNQEFVLYSATRLAGSDLREQTAVLSGGTDGIDGNSKAAGAVADAEMVINAAQRGVDASIFISSNDSHSFFRKVGGLVVTGPTGNNVRDLRILMAQ